MLAQMGRYRAGVTGELQNPDWLSPSIPGSRGGPDRGRRGVLQGPLGRGISAQNSFSAATTSFLKVSERFHSGGTGR